MTSETEKAMTTEEAIEQLGLGMIETVTRVATSDGQAKVWWTPRDTAALRHLIAEARKVERVRGKYATLRPESTSENYDVAQALDDGFHEAWEDVMAILSAPDAETEEESR